MTTDPTPGAHPAPFPTLSDPNAEQSSAWRERPWHPVTQAFFVALLGWAALVAFYDLSGGRALQPVEAWVAQPARETLANIRTMLDNVDEQGWSWEPFVLPLYGTEVRMQKSPGPLYAVMAIATLRGGEIDEFSVRLPNAIAAVLIVATVFWFTRRIAGDRAAIFAGFAAASSTMFLHWSHGGASDLGVTMFMTVALAFAWLGAEDERGGRRALYWMISYIAAGLAMIYKMPLPLPCVGLPIALYVLLRNRWGALLSWWHLPGIALFLLPWLPWAWAAMQMEPMALAKWEVEYFDRMTGELYNVQNQDHWAWQFFYLGVAFLLAIPYSLSIPGALVRGFTRQPGVRRDGTLFAAIWFISLLLFFTYSVGKETRYFLPAMPPLFVLLGIELSHFFNPRRRAFPALERLGLVATVVLVPAVFVGIGFLMRRYWEQDLSFGIVEWEPLLWAYVPAAAIFCVGAILAAVLYIRRREAYAFGALVAMMWGTWLYAWPTLLPIVAAAGPARDLAAQMQQLTPEQRGKLKQIAHQDPRILWYGDIAFPRIIDQLDLLEMVGGERSIILETRLVGEEMIRQLQGDELSLMVTSAGHYVLFVTDGRATVEHEGVEWPEHHVWMIANKGHWAKRYLIISNQPPPWDEPALPEPMRERIRIRLAKARALDSPPLALPDRSGTPLEQLPTIDSLDEATRAQLEELRRDDANDLDPAERDAPDSAPGEPRP